MKTTTNTKLQLVKDVQRDFEARRLARKSYELQWQLNIDFLQGRQNNQISNLGAVVPTGRQYYWQRNEVYNHLGTVVESRLAKLVSDREQIYVIPLTPTEKDKKCASLCEKIVKSAFKKSDIRALADTANAWSEMTGTAFYKVTWNQNGGKNVGEINGTPVFEGDISISVASPFEIYPDTLTASNINDCSIIHARPYSVDAVKKIWGESVAGANIEIHDFNRTGVHGFATISDAVMVIERYRDGELTIVAGDKLLYSGRYETMPFIRQTSEALPGSFFGRSVIERAIPVQRAYNAVKNRKTEFMNRMACGVLAVEDGSVDLEALENDGLAPGTIVTYTKGATPPKFLDAGVIPTELAREEERLLTELATITGGSDIARGDFSAVSGVALEIMVNQDKLRIQRAISSAQNARVAVAQRVLQLYKKHATAGRLDRLAMGKVVEIFSWTADDITSDEVISAPVSEAI